jgi:EAL domain-containing protein (putative c-di-GMP-specific phosphodiesterase class I)
LTVSVNVSPLQFRRPDFVDAVERILGETGFAPNQLELELTESTLLGNLESAELSMLRLKGVGVCFALDDFGTAIRACFICGVFRSTSSRSIRVSCA